MEEVFLITPTPVDEQKLGMFIDIDLKMLSAKWQPFCPNLNILKNLAILGVFELTSTEYVAELEAVPLCGGYLPLPAVTLSLPLPEGEERKGQGSESSGPDSI